MSAASLQNEIPAKIATCRFVKAPAATREHRALAFTGVSAFFALDQIGELQADKTTAISAVAGGFGHLLVQLAALKRRRVMGATERRLSGRSMGKAVVDLAEQDRRTSKKAGCDDR